MLSRRFIVSVLVFAALITLSTIAAYLWALSYAPGRAPTMAFMTLALAQIGHLGNARSREHVLAFRQIVSNSYALAGVGIALALQIAAAFFVPLRDLLDVVVLDATDWIAIVVLSALPAIVGQTFKLASRSRS
jgi:Ca2+-transporting ATPase